MPHIPAAEQPDSMDIDALVATATDASLATATNPVEGVDSEDPLAAVAEGKGLGSIDVKEELMKAFDASKSTFKGTYATLQKYDTTPNPCLDIDGLGVFGMPISAAEAERLRSRCNPAAFGKGERTVIDPTVRDTFELDASMVRFLNPSWEIWLLEAIQSACRELGLPGRSPHYELYKLLVYETGSHFHVHQDTEKAPGMFATVVIVLPSQHEGGSVHVQHGRQRKILQTSGQGLLTTSVMAWYTDVFHEVKPVTNGFRVALTYNLIHKATKTAIPRAPADDGVFDQIQEALRLWHIKELLGQKCPERLIHVLSHNYSQANLTFSHLKGPDATLVSLIRDAANMHGFYVALGHLDYTEKGYGEDDGPHKGYDSEEEETPGMCEVTDTELTLQLKSGLNGADIGREQTLSDSFEKDGYLMIDKHYWDTQKPDDEEYEGYMGNGAGSLEYFYHRTVVAIWPLSRNTAVISAVGGRDVAIGELEHCTSTIPTAVELSYVPLALTAGTSAVSCMVADLAIRWKDCQVWFSALKACKSDRDITVLGLSRVFTALDTFGFAGLREALDLIVSNTMSTKSRLEFIDALEMDNAERAEVATIPAAWFAEKKRYVLSSLRSPQEEDVAVVVNTLVVFPDGLNFLRDTLLAQLEALHLPYDWWFHFIDQLKAWIEGQQSFIGWQALLFNAAKPTFEKSVQHAASNQARFGILVNLEHLWSSHADAKSWILDTRKWAIHNLTQPGSGDAALVATFVRTEPRYLETILLPTLARMDYVEEFWVDLLGQFQSYARDSNHVLPTDWENLVADALRTPLTRARAKAATNQAVFQMMERLYALCESLKPIVAMLGGQKRDSLRSMKKPKDEEILLLLDQLKLDREYALSQFAPQLSAFHLDLALWSGFVHAVRTRAAEFAQSSWAPEDIQKLLTILVTEAISCVPLSVTSVPTSATTAQSGTSLFATTVRVFLTLCTETNNVCLCSSVFEKVFAVSTSAAIIKSNTLPLIPVVAAFAKDRGLSVDQPPFDRFFREVIRLYVVLVLGRKPGPEDSKRWRHSLCSSCSCADCRAVNSLIVSAQHEGMWGAAYHRRGHVENQLRSKKGLKLTTSTSGNPHRLVVTKLIHQYDPAAVWAEKRKLGATILQAIGGDEVLQRLYASAPGRLSSVMGCLRGDASPSSLGDSEYSTSSLATPAVASTSHSALSNPAQAGASIIPRKRQAPLPNPEDIIEISD